MKAMIMAGGEGARLRPMTCDCPKPMLPLLGRPVMEYALGLLKRHGIREAGVTLMYLPRRVQEYFGDGQEYGMSLRYYVENRPLGTAGSVALARSELDETFLVLSGDGVTDCDLTAAIQFHREQGAAATLVVRHVENPLEYGVVMADAAGQVTRFVEKPGWDQVCSDTVNTGIYILEPEVLAYIPEGKNVDFSKDVFPELLRHGEKLCAWTTEGYWCDIGDVGSYLRAHMDALDGKIDLGLPIKPGGVNRMPGAEVDRSAVLEGPCYIGRNARVEEGARIGPYSVIGENSVVGPYASVKRSVLMNDVTIKENAQIRGAVIMDGASLCRDSSLFEEGVLGSRVRLGEGAAVLSGVKVWPDKDIPAGTRVEKHVVWGGIHREDFRGDCLALGRLEDCVQAMRAYVSAVRPRCVLLCGERSAVAEAWREAVSAALISCGVRVVMGGCGTLPQTRYQLRCIGVDGCCFVTPGCIRLLDDWGAELGGGLQRAIQQRMQREEGASPLRKMYRKPEIIEGAKLYYQGMLAQIGEGDGRQLALYAQDEDVLETAESACRCAGYQVRAEWEEELMDLAPAETGAWLSEDAQSFHLADLEGGLSGVEEETLRAWVLLEEGEKRLIVPASATHSLDLLVDRYGARIERVRSESSTLLHALAEESDMQFMMRTDGIYGLLLTLRALGRAHCTLKDWRRGMPLLKRRVMNVPMGFDKRGKALSSLSAAEKQADLTEGICVKEARGWAMIAPSAEKAECLVIGEAMDMEAADELCSLYTEKLVKTLSE